MKDNKSDKSRRKLLKSIAAGSGAIVAGKSLPDSWSRPVVDSVMLPAHAQTSYGPYAGAATTPGSALEPESIFAKAADSLIPQADASVYPTIEPYACVEPNADLDKATVKLFVRAIQYTFNDVPVGGSNCDPTQTILCVVDAGELLRDFGLIKDAHAVGPPETICCFVDTVTGVGAGRVEFEFHDNVHFNVGPNSCNPPDMCNDL